MSVLLEYLDKSITLPQLGTAWRSSICADICEAARTISYVETCSPEKADTFHKYISFADDRALKKAMSLLSDQC